MYWTWGLIFFLFRLSSVDFGFFFWRKKATRKKKYHLILQQKFPADDQLGTPLHRVRDVDPVSQFVEQRKRFLHDGFQFVPGRMMIDDWQWRVRMRIDNSIFIFSTSRINMLRQKKKKIDSNRVTDIERVTDSLGNWSGYRYCRFFPIFLIRNASTPFSSCTPRIVDSRSFTACCSDFFLVSDRMVYISAKNTWTIKLDEQ